MPVLRTKRGSERLRVEGLSGFKDESVVQEFAQCRDMSHGTANQRVPTPQYWRSCMVSIYSGFCLISPLHTKDLQSLMSHPTWPRGSVSNSSRSRISSSLCLGYGYLTPKDSPPLIRFRYMKRKVIRMIHNKDYHSTQIPRMSKKTKKSIQGILSKTLSPERLSAPSD